jgi:bifunctional DNase/RNase
MDYLLRTGGRLSSYGVELDSLQGEYQEAIMIEVRVDSIRVSLTSDQRVVTLKEVHSERYLPIWIGMYEADAIARRLQNRPFSRPLTHDLLNNVIAEMGGEVSRIVVTDMRDNVYYASIIVDVDGQVLEIDSRPSDAIALAVRAGAAIFVDEQVMAQAGHTPEEDVSEDVDGQDLAAFREFVNNLDLDDLPIQ